MEVAAWLRKFELDFRYGNPVSGSLRANKGIPILFGEGVRIVFRPCGTGTAGAMLRVHLETWEQGAKRHRRDAQAAVRTLIRIADQLAGMRPCIGRKSLVT